MKKRNLYTFLLSAALVCTSCGDFLSEYSQDMIIPKTVSDIDEVLLGSGYLPSVKNDKGPSYGSCGFFNILDDDVNTGYNKGGYTSGAWINSVSPMFGYFAWQFKVGLLLDGTVQLPDNRTWDDLYGHINVINVLLDEIQELPHSTEKDEAAFYRVQGECYFLRAYFYFTLANLYGDAYDPATCTTKLCVPLKLTAAVEHDKDKDTQFQRATIKEVYDQIVADLTVAEEYLTRSPQASSRTLYRASVEAVDLLFSRVYLYMQDWSLAEEKAAAVLKSTRYTLMPVTMLNGETEFLGEDNTEIIHSQGSNYVSAFKIFTGASGDFCVSRELYNLYGQGDRRLNFFTTNVQDSVALGNKYKRTDDRTHISDAFTLRLAEAYLNEAEACAIQGGAKEQTANRLLNELRRNRIDGYENQNYTGAELVQQIRDERRKELCFEGHRWFDLRRYAVCTDYPYSKQITHVFNRCGDWGVIETRTYVLKEHDPAYTFAIPEAVINFDKIPMEDNPREERKPLKAEQDGEQDKQ